MDVLVSAANWLLPLVYLALAIDYGATFILRTRTHARSPGVLLAVILHIAFLVLWGVHSQRPPLTSIPELLSVIALCCAILYGGTELLCRDRRAGVFVFLLVFLLQYSSSIFLTATKGQGGSGQYHMIPASLAYTSMAFAAMYALLYLTGQRNLKQHRFGLLFDRLPPLELLGKMSGYALLVGFGLMTVTIVTGSVFFGRSGGERSLLSNPKILTKIITGLVAWGACAVAILGKWFGKWSVSSVSRIALVGFLVVVVLFATSIILS